MLCELLLLFCCGRSLEVHILLTAEYNVKFIKVGVAFGVGALVVLSQASVRPHYCSFLAARRQS